MAYPPNRALAPVLYIERISDRVRRAFDLAFENGVLWNPQIFEILDAATRR